MYIQVNIGRDFEPNKHNETGGTLSDFEWRCFKIDAELALSDNRIDPTTEFGDAEVFLGTGFWEGEAEESAKISMYHEGGFDLDGIRERLFRLKKEYSQSTIALIIGSELI